MFKVVALCGAIALGGCQSLNAEEVRTMLQAMDEYDKQCEKTTVLAIMVSPLLPPSISLNVNKDCPGV